MDGGEGAQTCAPSGDTSPAPLSAVAAWWGVPGPELAERRSRCDSSAEGAGGSLGLKGASGRRNRLSGCLRRLGRGCSAASSGRYSGLSGPGAAAVPAAAAINLRRRGPGRGRSQSSSAPSSGGKVERCWIRAAEKRQK